MVSINKNRITMTRGDTLRVSIAIMVGDEEYTPVTGETVRFAVKRRVMDSSDTEYADSKPLIMKVIPNSTMVLTLNPEDTKQLGFGTYDYDLQITFEDGTVDTFVTSTLKLTKEVE